MEKGVKTESFEESLERSSASLQRAMQLFMEAGWHCCRLEHFEGKEDYGDLLLWLQDDKGRKYWFHTVDVKQNANWDDCEFPFETIYLTSNDQLHPDWWYLVFNSDMSRCGFVDMNKVYMGEVQYDSTTNRRGGEQVSAGIPVKHVKFRKLS